MSSFKNKNVLITGGARGIGRLLALKSLEAGAENMVIWDVDAQAMERLGDEADRPDSSILFNNINVGNPSRIRDGAREVLARLGHIDILINNAGIVVGKPFYELSPRDIERTLQINAGGVMQVTAAFLPAMIERNCGHIVNISSAVSLMANPGMSVYAGSKWAVTGWSESLRLELREVSQDLKVTLIQPGYIDTGMFDGVTPPLFTPLLKPEYLAEKIMQAVKSDSIHLRKPFMVKLIPFLKGVLPTVAFDFLAGRIFGVYRTMETFKGREDDR